MRVMTVKPDPQIFAVCSHQPSRCAPTSAFRSAMLLVTRLHPVVDDSACMQSVCIVRHDSAYAHIICPLLTETGSRPMDVDTHIFTADPTHGARHWEAPKHMQVISTLQRGNASTSDAHNTCRQSTHAVLPSKRICQHQNPHSPLLQNIVSITTLPWDGPLALRRHRFGILQFRVHHFLSNCMLMGISLTLQFNSGLHARAMVPAIRVQATTLHEMSVHPFQVMLPECDAAII